MTLLLAGGNLVFNVSAGTDTVSVETEKSGIEKNADPEKNNVPDYAPFSEMVTMQKAAETQDEGGVTENADTEDSVDEEEKADAETNDEPAMENSGQVSETTDDGITSDNNGSVSSYENLPAGVPYTSGFTTTSGVASIVAPGAGEFFTITEMGPILMIMGADTVIREMETGQMPMAIHIVPGMTKIIIPETNWNSMNSRAVTVPLL